MKNIWFTLILFSSVASAQINHGHHYLKIVDNPSSVLKSQTDSTVSVLNSRLLKLGYKGSLARYDEAAGQFVITGKDILDTNFIRLVLIKPFKVFFYETYSLEELTYTLSLHGKDKKMVEQIQSFYEVLHINETHVINNRLSYLGTLSLADTAKFKKVQEAIKNYLPADIILAFPKNLSSPTASYIEIYALKNNAAKLCVNEMLASCKAGVDGRGHPNIQISFNKTGAQWFAKITSNNTGRPLAIVIDNRVVSAPFVNGPVEGGKAEITGTFSSDEAKQLVDIINAGSLPLRLGFVR